MRAVALAAVLLELSACGPAAIKPYLSDEDVAALRPDTKAACLLGAGIWMPGALQEARLITVEGVQTTAGAGGGVLFFVNVPKGPFRVVLLRYKRFTVKTDRVLDRETIYSVFSIGRAVQPQVELGTYVSVGSGTGDVPNHLSGICHGGFIWLGEFTGYEGGHLGRPKLAFKSAFFSPELKEMLSKTREKLGNSAWAAEMENPFLNTPLPRGLGPVVRRE